MTDIDTIEVDKIAKKAGSKFRKLSELAQGFLKELIGELPRFQVEEIVHDDGFWRIHVSYDESLSEPNALQRSLGINVRRVRKEIRIDWNKQQVVALTDWHPAGTALA